MAENPKMLMEKDGPLGWIIFNQPEKRNAVSQEMWQMVPDMVQDLEEDQDIRVIILRGAGDQAFVAGADISQFKDRRRNMEDEQEYRRISGRGSQSLADIQKPLLAMIQGYCIGGGVGIAITCDLRIASDEARFGVPAARLPQEGAVVLRQRHVEIALDRADGVRGGRPGGLPAASDHLPHQRLDVHVRMQYKAPA